MIGLSEQNKIIELLTHEWQELWLIQKLVDFEITEDILHELESIEKIEYKTKDKFTEEFLVRLPSHWKTF